MENLRNLGERAKLASFFVTTFGVYDGPTWSIASTSGNTSREDRQIVSKIVTGHSVTSRTMAQHFESVTYHSVSACTIRRRFQQSGLSAIRPLLGLPLTQNSRRLRRQWCNERKSFLLNALEISYKDMALYVWQQLCSVLAGLQPNPADKKEAMRESSHGEQGKMFLTGCLRV
ncbi:transposable element Tc1 transposase [Trichonephila clavipes]|nr:transposable element Tc1 transposase [Trichonephila clavipes]